LSGPVFAQSDEFNTFQNDEFWSGGSQPPFNAPLPLRKPKTSTITLPSRTPLPHVDDKASPNLEALQVSETKEDTEKKADSRGSEDTESISTATTLHSVKEQRASDTDTDEPSGEQALSPVSQSIESVNEDLFGEEDIVEEELEEAIFEADAEAEIARIAEEIAPVPEAESAQETRREPEKQEEITTPTHAAQEARIPLPRRKPSKVERSRAARAAARARTEARAGTDRGSARSQPPKLPQSGKPKTHEQQCAALQICRTAFSKCRFSKKREETDADGWEVHKKKCGDIYNKCIKQHFGQGEMFFTRWFLPFDPCS